jgi:hypothetical protein
MKPYIQHEGKVIETGGKFTHVMAITLDPRTKHTIGALRCITSREGDVTMKGYVDRSKLFKIKGTSLDHFEITEELQFKNAENILAELSPPGWDFIGLEDPDIFIDEHDMMHLYFTIPIKPTKEGKNKGDKTKIHLGHAVGKDLDSLEMTMPVLLDEIKVSAKEVSIAPLNSQGFRYNLVESRDRRPEATYSVVQVAIAKDMGAEWQYGDVAFHPKDQKISWIGGHASPGPLFSKEFLDVGEGKRLGVMNGREANTIENGQTKYNIFSVGLFIYDFEKGKIDWVSPEYLIRDSEARTITFASQVVETKPGETILYAHVDDSFVRAYTLDAQAIKNLLP